MSSPHIVMQIRFAKKIIILGRCGIGSVLSLRGRCHLRLDTNFSLLLIFVGCSRDVHKYTYNYSSKGEANTIFSLLRFPFRRRVVYGNVALFKSTTSLGFEWNNVRVTRDVSFG